MPSEAIYVVTVENSRPLEARHTHLRSYRGNLKNVSILHLCVGARG
jgi:transposase-like protein